MSPLRSRLPTSELEQLELAAKFFRGLGDPTRLKILELLFAQERTVSELVKILGVPQGRVSNHLACLKWCGYVATRPEGRHIHYRIADKRIHKVLALARRMVADNAARIWACTRIDQGSP
ncbi:MAG: ArsR/SmtB family transcription factor [Candidatus Methylomirabilales bacterium]